ncbi:hypothetical protein R1flu_006298 [Riccia fluitans]|uniref:Uncharacterized protein n=1 Tax=Riccia fluitans TaxID=41844 RepID=A0ABD1YVL9_9MARC
MCSSRFVFSPHKEIDSEFPPGIMWGTTSGTSSNSEFPTGIMCDTTSSMSGNTLRAADAAFGSAAMDRNGHCRITGWKSPLNAKWQPWESTLSKADGVLLFQL